MKGKINLTNVERDKPLRKEIKSIQQCPKMFVFSSFCLFSLGKTSVTVTVIKKTKKQSRSIITSSLCNKSCTINIHKKLGNKNDAWESKEIPCDTLVGQTICSDLLAI